MSSSHACQSCLPVMPTSHACQSCLPVMPTSQDLLRPCAVWPDKDADALAIPRRQPEQPGRSGIQRVAGIGVKRQEVLRHDQIVRRQTLYDRQRLVSQFIRVAAKEDRTFDIEALVA
jgi:hypothetical protein